MHFSNYFIPRNLNQLHERSQDGTGKTRRRRGMKSAEEENVQRLASHIHRRNCYTLFSFNDKNYSNKWE